jgi:hypothetical protein
MMITRPTAATTTTARVLALAAPLALGLAFFTPPAAAQQQQRAGGATAAAPRRAVSFEPLFSERITALEADIGRLMQRRVDDSAGVPRELELRIDVRLVARWMLTRAAAAEAGGDLQAAAWIRANDLLQAAALAEKEFDASAGAPATPAGPAKALHDLTFKLGDAKSVADLDAASRAAALALLTAMGGDAHTARLPVMRPAAPAEGALGGGGRRTVDQLAARARELAVSVPLRAQLLAVSNAAGQVAQDPKRKGELADVRDVLDDAVTLAEGLQSNTAVGREDRVRMEQQVAQGLAMFLDPRTRAAGQKRVAALGQYRQMLARLRELNLPPELLKRFGPAFAWAQRNPDGGAQVMAAIELFLRHDPRFASPPPLNGLTGVAAKAAEAARQRAQTSRDQFLAASANSFANPDALGVAAGAFRDDVDALHTIARATDALKVLNGYRPRPFGGIDKRAQLALQAWMNDAPDAERRAAAQFLARLVRLADHAAEIAAPPKTGPADSDAGETRRRYTNGLTEQFNARRKAVVAEIANAVAAGQPLDDGTLAPLERMSTLLGAVRSAAKAEQAVLRAEALARWVDWGVDGKTVEAVLAPYRSATAATFEGFARGGAAPYVQWEAVRRRYEPVLAFLEGVAGHADACESLPPGRAGALAKLTTPLGAQPFATERAARLSLDAWFHYRQTEDAATADAVFDALASRLRR